MPTADRRPQIQALESLHEKNQFVCYKNNNNSTQVTEEEDYSIYIIH
jgi:hypothetical protein